MEAVEGAMQCRAPDRTLGMKKNGWGSVSSGGSRVSDVGGSVVGVVVVGRRVSSRAVISMPSIRSFVP